MKMIGNDRSLLDMATEIGAENGTCNRLRAGIVIAKRGENNSLLILVTGFNTAPAGMETCDSSDHLMHNGHCMRTVHAENVAVGLAAKRGIALDGATAYVSHTPCLPCAKLLITAGINKIVYLQEYGNAENKELLSEFSRLTGVPISLCPGE